MLELLERRARLFIPMCVCVCPSRFASALAGDGVPPDELLCFRH